MRAFYIPNMLARRLVFRSPLRCLSKCLSVRVRQPFQSFNYKAACLSPVCHSSKWTFGHFSASCQMSTRVKMQSEDVLHEAVPHSQDGLKLVWNDGFGHVFNYIWLRDNCKCSLCVDHETKQKRLDTPLIQLDVMPEKFGINYDDNVLNVVWVDDPKTGERHDSTYNSSWLHRHGSLVTEQQFHPHKHKDVKSPVVLWDVEVIKDKMPEVEYDDVMGSDEGLFKWLSGIYRYGLGLIRNAPTEEQTIVDIAKQISYIKETSYGVLFDVVALPQNVGHLAYTGEMLLHHTDLNYREKSPGIQILHCIHSSGSRADEGLSLFVDGFYVADWLRKHNPSAFHILSSLPVEFKIVYKENTYKHHVPIICVDNNGDIEEVHVNNRTMGPLHAPHHVIKPFYSAYKALTDKIREATSELQFQLGAGDIVAFNNRRVLHGRTRYNPQTVKRHLKGCYIDYDEFLSRLQSLEDQFITQSM